MDPLNILKKQFGHNTFRLHQEEVIRSVCAGHDAFVLMPTGGGKSLCYQIPAVALDGLTIVVSPLIALMKDQVDALRLTSVPAAYLNSTQTWKEQEKIIADASKKALKLLYLAPERLLGNGMAMLHRLRPCGISLVAIDEAHCISHWGHDFRPEYRMLANIKTHFSDVPVIALTATADKLTQRDILEKLQLRDPKIFISGFNRPNIHYGVKFKKSAGYRQLFDFLDKRKHESGIVYCLSRRSTEQVAAELELRGFSARAYHAGMDREQRCQNQELFLRDEVKIIVATIAFGMGIDKPNVRYVVHMDLPKNMEGYYQETGRAGRDGLASEALLLYSSGDLVKLKKFALIENNPEQTGIQLKKLDEMARYAELRTCRREYLLNYFDEASEDHCGNCDVCRTREETLMARSADEFMRKRMEVDALLRSSAAAHALDEIAGILEPNHETSQRKGLRSRMYLPAGKTERSNTKKQTMDMFRRGMSVEEIAHARTLSTGTIESHLASYVATGQLPVDELVAHERIQIIQEAIERVGGRAAGPIREYLGEEFSYAEIRYVIADLECHHAQEIPIAGW